MTDDYGMDEEEMEELEAETARQQAEDKARDASIIASESEVLPEGTTMSEGQLDRIRRARLRAARAAEEEANKGEEEDDDAITPLWTMFGGEHWTESAMEEIEELFYNDDPELEENATARLFAYYLQMEGQRK